MNKLADSMLKLVTVTLRIVVGGLVFIPLSHIVPKKKSVVFITRFGMGFEGNLKYLYLYLLSLKDPEYEFYFLTSNKDIKRELESENLPVIFYPSISGLWRLFRTGAIIVDGNEWVRQFKYQILHAARKYQLWHGSGMKTVGLLKPRVKNQSLPLRVVTFLLGLHPRYDIVSLNSKVQLETRGKAFNYKRFIINGQPRNDVLFVEDVAPYMNGTDRNAYEQVLSYRRRGFRVVLYSPTHRKPTEAFRKLKDTLDPKALDEYAKKNKLLFVFKYHPKTREEHEYDLSGTENIILYDKYKDVYPLFKQVDLMITDYSSIFVDYILLDRPVVFFAFDYDHYVNSERALQFDYDTVTPGRKCGTLEEVIDEMDKTLLRGEDGYRDERKRVLANFYDIVDGNSSERIWTEIRNTWDAR